MLQAVGILSVVGGRVYMTHLGPSKENRDIALAAYGSDLGRRWCSVWDWGDRSKHPIRHLEELLERCETELEGDVSIETREILTRIKKESQAALDKWKKPIHL